MSESGNSRKDSSLISIAVCSTGRCFLISFNVGFAILSGWITNAADLIYARHLQPNAGFANVTNTSQGESAATPVSRNMVNYKVPAARVHSRFGSTREPRGQPLRHMEQLLLVIEASAAINGMKCRSVTNEQTNAAEQMDGQT